MISIFTEYLTATGKLPLEGLGYLKVKAIPAKMDITTRLLEAPRQEYEFEAFSGATAISFFSWLKGHSMNSMVAGESLYQDLIRKVQHLDINQSLEWKGLGIWKMNEAKIIEFEYKSLSFPTLKPIQAEKIVRSDAVHTIRVGEQQSDSIEMTKLLSEKSKKKVSALWLIVVLVIAVASFLCWSLLIGNMLPSSLSNPAKITPQEGAVQYRTL